MVTVASAFASSTDEGSNKNNERFTVKVKELTESMMGTHYEQATRLTSRIAGEKACISALQKFCSSSVSAFFVRCRRIFFEKGAKRNVTDKIPLTSKFGGISSKEILSTSCGP
uniref:Uncharacterized protein n=1 Tax=Romanomermis culicivorax TaxID=13658 RepID=A0A915HZS9_ROMCU